MEFYDDAEIQRLAQRRDILETELKQVKQQLIQRHNELRAARFEVRIAGKGIPLHYSAAVMASKEFMHHTRNYVGYVDVKLYDTLYVIDYYPEYDTFEIATYNPYVSGSGTVIPGIPTAIVRTMTADQQPAAPGDGA